MLYIFKDSVGNIIKVTEREAREILNGRGGLRIKMNYLGAVDEAEYKKQLSEIGTEARAKFPARDLMDDDAITNQRNFTREREQEIDKDLVAKADSTKQPSQFKIFGMNNAGESSDRRVDNQEEINPIFRGMIQ
jgi:hypothetical protein